MKRSEPVDAAPPRWQRAVAVTLAASVALATFACARPTPQSQPYSTPLAWVAQPPDRVGVFYLLGSIHVGTDSMRPLHPEILAAWAGAEELVVEVDLTHIGEDFASTWAERAALPRDVTLREKLSPKTWEALTEYLEQRDLTVEAFADLKPWAVLLKLAQLEFATEGLAAAHGVDRQFLDSAAGDKPVVALESYALQLDLYDGFPYPVQDMMLHDLLRPASPYATSLLLDVWSRGDEQAFVELLFPESEEWELYRERFFFERNENMARGLEDLARDGKTRFVVVGVGHMVGPRGIPALLSNRGFALQRIGTR